MRSHAVQQSPAGFAAIALQRAGIRTRLEDSGYRFRIHPVEEAAPLSLTEADLTFGFDPADIRRYGGVGDSNGTTGNGTNNLTAIQRAVDVAKRTSFPVTAGPGIYRHAGPITFTHTAAACFAFGGVSMLDTAFFADYVSAVRVANFDLRNEPATRVRVHFHDFRMFGRGATATNIVGLCLEWTSEQTRVENVYIASFDEGILAANDYYTKFVNVQCVVNISNGMRLGYELDGATLGACFNVGLYSCDLTLNGAWGLVVFGAQSFSSHGTGIQGNKAGQIFANLCEGSAMFGTYVEHGDNEVDTPTAQVYVLNCNGFGIYGLACPAFMDDGSPIVRVETSDAVTLANFACRVDAGPFNASAVENFASTLTIADSFIRSADVGLRAQGGGTTTLRNVKFATCPQPVLSNGAANKIIWHDAAPADVAASTFDVANLVNIVFNDGTTNRIDGSRIFRVSVSAAELNAGGKILIDSLLPSERWQIDDIKTFLTTPFSGGGGDRLLQILDAVGPVIYSSIPSANLTGASQSNRWGSAGVPMQVSADVHTATTAQHDLRAQYVGGSANYTAGSIQLTITATRIA